MKKLPVSAIILAKNEATMLPGCLHTLRWCSEVLIIDDGSTDGTASVAEDAGARVISFKHQSFARKREEGAKHAASPWLLYIDSDERVTPELVAEISAALHEKQSLAAYSINRENIFFGQAMHHGGWETDVVTRLIKKDQLSGWKGEIHESPKISGEIGQLQEPLVHFSHRSVSDGLLKSADWTKTEALLLSKTIDKPVTLPVIIRKGLGEFWRRVIQKRGYRDGMVGYIEGLIQAINRVLVYIQIWEFQQSPPIPDLYAVKERELQILWEQQESKEA
ncbi:glycosyltransferase family 2 protein [Candidatus Woesebacteria bacterium]|nr:glycosyltransferase family 2 protein [Candidatus Woesebacteria bacterium]